MSEAKATDRLEAARRSKLAQQAPLICDDEPQRHYTQVHNNVSRCSLLSDGAFRAYFNIKSHYWGRGSCFPGLELLASYQGVSERMMRRYVAELKDAGLIQVTQRGLGLTNEYLIPSAQHWTPAVLEAQASAQAARSTPPEQGAEQTGHVVPLRQNSNGPDMGFRSGPDMGFRSGPDMGFRLRRRSNKKTQIEEDTDSASPRTGPRAARANGATAPEPHRQSEDDAPKPTAAKRSRTGRERACKTPEEEAEREDFLHLFGERIKPVGQTDVGRFRNEALRAIRAYGYREMCGCLEAMASSKRFVGQPFVSPVTVAHNVLTWQEAGSPRAWRKVEEWAQNKAQRQGVTW